MLQLPELFKDQNVAFRVIDNSGKIEDARIVGVDALQDPKIRYASVEDAESRARKAIENEYKRREGTADAIPYEIYEGNLGGTTSERGGGGQVSKLVSEGTEERSKTGTRAGGESQDIGLTLFQDTVKRMKQAGPESVLDGQLNKDALDALEQTLLDRLEKAFSEDAIKQARVLPTGVEQEIDQYLKSLFMPELNTQLQQASAAGRFFQDSSVLNYDGQWNIEAALLLERPFVHWWLHTALNYTRDFMDHPALLAFLLHLRNNWDKQSEGMPDRFKGKIPFNMPFAEQFGLGDTIWGAPMRTLFPYEDTLQLNALQRAQYNDGEGDLGGVVNDVFGIHTPIKLGINALTQDWEEFQNTFASIPAARLLKAGTGIGLESKYDKYYVERAAKELVAEGALTDEQVKVAMLTRKGSEWQAIQQRANVENYTMRELSALGGMRGIVFTPGEQKYLASKQVQQNALTEAVRRLGGNPTMADEEQYAFLKSKNYFSSEEYQNLRARYPELGIGSFLGEAYSEDGKRLPEPEVNESRYRAYLVDKIWDKINGASRLQARVWKADLGDDFYNLFYKKDSRNYDAVPTKQLLGWANALEVDLPDISSNFNLKQEIPDPFKVRFPSSEQNAQYEKFYNDVESAIGWDNVNAWNKQYYSLDKTQRKEFLKTPEGKKLKMYWDFKNDFYADKPELLDLVQETGTREIESEREQGFSSPLDPKKALLSQAVTMLFGDWTQVDRWKEEYYALPKGTGERTAYLKKNQGLLRYFELVKTIYGDEEESTGAAPTTSARPKTASLPYYLRPSYGKTATYRNQRPGKGYGRPDMLLSDEVYALFAAARRARNARQRPQQPADGNLPYLPPKPSPRIG